MHMRVHTFIHQYQYRYTNTVGYDDASIMCGDFYTLTTSKVSTWAVPATRPMEPSFRVISFQKTSILSAQAAGSGSPPGPRSIFFSFFLEAFSDPRVYRYPNTPLLRSVFFCSVEKVCSKARIGYVGWGLRRDPLLHVLLPQSTKQNRKN